MRSAAALMLALFLGVGAGAETRAPAPARVTILGYEGDAMEPFLSRDGGVLFFNNRNDPPERTDLHWSERIDDLTFRYRGLVGGANSAALDGVATMARSGRFCFVSTRSYFDSLTSLYCGDWRDGEVNAVALQADASFHTLGRLMFDVEMSAAGDVLVLSDGLFRGGAAPASADLRFAQWRDGRFVLAPAMDAQLAAVNGAGLDYAAGLSADGLTLGFTRLRAAAPMFAPRRNLDRPPSVARGAVWGAAASARDHGLCRSADLHTRWARDLFPPARPQSLYDLARRSSLISDYAARFSRSGRHSPRLARAFICARCRKAACAAAMFSALPDQAFCGAACRARP